MYEKYRLTYGIENSWGFQFLVSDTSGIHHLRHWFDPKAKMKDTGRETSTWVGTPLLSFFFLPGKEQRMRGNVDEFRNLKEAFCFLSKEGVNSSLLIMMGKQAGLGSQGGVVIVRKSWPGMNLREHRPVEGQGRHFGEILKGLTDDPLWS